MLIPAVGSVEELAVTSAIAAPAHSITPAAAAAIACFPTIDPLSGAPVPHLHSFQQIQPRLIEVGPKIVNPTLSFVSVLYAPPNR